MNESEGKVQWGVLEVCVWEVKIIRQLESTVKRDTIGSY